MTTVTQLQPRSEAMPGRQVDAGSVLDWTTIVPTFLAVFR